MGISILPILISLLAGAFYSGLLYRKDTLAYSKKWIQPALAIARLVVVSLLVWLLFSPTIKRLKTEVQQPLLVILQDNSSSLAQKQSQDDREKYWDKIAMLKKKLAVSFDVKSHNFSDKLSEWMPPDFSGKETDMSSALSEVADLYSGQPIGAIVLATDGIYNKGNSPLYHTLLKTTPIYTISLGDTTPQKDIRISSLRYNEMLYSGDKMAMQVQISAYGMQGEESVLEVNGPDGFRFSQTIVIDQPDFLLRTEVVSAPLKPGIQKFYVSIKNKQGDQVPANNTGVAYVEVLDGREKVLLLYNSPHPDIKALRSVADQNPNLSFEAADAELFRGNINDYSLVILHGLPSSTTGGTALAAALNSVKPIFFIVSSQTDISKLNAAQQLVKLQAGKIQMQEVQAIANPRFAKFGVDQALLDHIRDLPPLYSPVGTFSVTNLEDALFTQQIGSVSSGFPLMTLGESGTRKAGVLMAEGIWRWRMYDYLLHGNQQTFDGMFGKIIQYLTVKDDKRPFRLKVSKSVYAENEAVILDAELFNASFELVNDPDVSVVIAGEDEKKYSFTMDKTTNAYTLMAGIFGVGDYTASAKVVHNGKTYTAAKSFSVKPLIIESMRLEADHKLLADISRESGGKMVPVNGIDQLEKLLDNEDKMKPVLYDRITTNPILNIKWILGLLILLLSLEWFARKYMGGY